MNKKSIFFLLAIFGTLLAFPVEAAPPAGSMADVGGQVQLASLKFYDNIQGMAMNLLFGLFGVAFVWETINMVLKRSEFQEVVVNTVRAMIAVLTYSMFIKYGSVWMQAIVDSVKIMASTGAGVPTASLNPAAIMAMGIDLQDQMILNFNQQSGGDTIIGALSNFFPSLMIVCVVLILLLAFGLIAFNLFLAYTEMYLLIAVAPLLFAMGGSKWTRDNAMKPWQSMIAVGVKIAVIAIIANVAIQAIPAWGTQLSTWKIDNWTPLWDVAMSALGVGVLALMAPKLASAALAGGSAMSAGDAIQAGGNIGGMATGVGAAALGVAAAGASGASKAAQALGGAGAEAGGVAKALKAGFDQNRNAGMGFAESAARAPVPGIKSAANMAGVKMAETGKSLTEGGKGMLAQAGEAINNSVGGQVASKISEGSNASAAGGQESTNTPTGNSASTPESSPSKTQNTDTPSKNTPGNATGASIGGGNQPSYQSQTQPEHSRLLDKLAHMRDFVPPEGMVSGGSVSHVHDS
ncbi:MAG: P-type conjugative transfer protein TrbL [Nitrosomonas sp.]|nr:P-type conjugative transfer protein TrbL [Moraxellaceae bacterium]MDP1952041.1 P-type conjugative transfer protein TrbL [Nitrosomonas sp.]